MQRVLILAAAMAVVIALQYVLVILGEPQANWLYCQI